MLPKVGTYKFNVATFEEDYKGQLSWRMLGKRLLGAADKHASERNFSKMVIDDIEYLWVLSRLTVEIDSYPKMHEDYFITTWAQRYYSFFTDRCFEICNDKGDIIGKATSVWAMINSLTRKPAKMADLFGETFDKYVDAERLFSMVRSPRINVNTLETTAIRIPHYSNLDRNGHVHSIDYIEMVLDLFSKEFHAQHDVKRFEIAYNMETLENEPLSFYMEPAFGKELTYNCIIRKNVDNPNTEGEIVCHTMVEFR